jgi:hypothetical protein
MEDKRIKCRVFLVGCGRSGTTLLQSYIGSHSQIAAFPETNFVGIAVGDYGERYYCKSAGVGLLRKIARILRIKTGFCTRAVRGAISEMLHNMNYDESLNCFDNFPIRIPAAIKKWSGILDKICLSEGKSVWIEKTPMHLAYISEITDALPEAKFIHIIRRPDAVISSMLDAGEKYPEWQDYKSVEYCLKLWNKSVAFSIENSSKNNHVIVRYEDFVERKDEVIKEIFNFLGVQDESLDEIERKRKLTSRKISLKSEPWKNNVSKEIKNNNKSDIFLNENDIRYINRNAVVAPPSTLMCK